MLKSPVQYSSRLASRDVTALSASTQVSGIPCGDARRAALPFVAGDVDFGVGVDTIEFSDGHGLETDDPVTFLGANLPAPLASYPTYYAIKVSPTLLQFSLKPGSTALDLTDAGGGSDLVMEARCYPKYVQLTNYGANPVAVRPHVGPTYTMDTDDEFVIATNCGHPCILNVSGFNSIASRGVGGNSNLRITPLENF